MSFLLSELWQIVACCLFVFSTYGASLSCCSFLLLLSYAFYSVLSLSLPLPTSFVKTNTPWQQKVLRIINTPFFLLLLFSFGSCMRVCIWHFFFGHQHCLNYVTAYSFVRDNFFLVHEWIKKTGKTLNAYIYIYCMHIVFLNIHS